VIAEFEHGLATFELRGSRNQCAHCGSGSTLPADDATQIALRHEQLDERLSSVRALRYADGVRAVRQGAGHDLDDVASPAHDAACSVAGAAGGIRATSVRIVSDGRAPLFNQWSSRSRLSSNVSGFVRGL
jgi:hypothetical protein